MKKMNLFKTTVLSVLYCTSTMVSAQTLVSNFDDFDAAFASMKSASGGTIELTANITIPIAAEETYSLSSTAGAPVIINVGTFAITGSGTGTTTDNAVLEIGDNVSVLGSATLIKNTNRAMIRVTGGVLKTTTVAAGGGNAAVINASAGWAYISGGTITMDASSITSGNAFVVYMANSYTLNITGGTIEGIGNGVRAVRISDGVANISGATISVSGNAYALLSNGGNMMTVGDNTTINAADNAFGLVSGGATSRLIIPATAENVTINSSNPYKLDNNNAALFDLRDLVVTADPASGHIFTEAGTVSFIVEGASAALANFYYDFTNSPTISSSNVKTIAIPVTTDNTVIKVRLGKGSWIDSNEYTFIYNDPFTSVTDEESDSGLQISSLVDNVLYINTLVDNIVVFDLNGKIVKQVAHTDKVNVVDLNSGIYIVKVNSGNDQSIIKIAK